MFKDYKYSVIFKTYITSFFRFLLLSTSNDRMSEGTFCRIEVHIVKMGCTRVYQFFLFLHQNIDCGYSLEQPHRGGSNVYLQSLFLAKIRKISFFFMEYFNF